MKDRNSNEVQAIDARRESESDSELYGSDEHEDDQVDITVLKRGYVDKQDIIDAVAAYHAQIMRPFNVAKSDKRRYKVVCPVVGCNFLAQFAFTSSFDRHPRLVSHSCDPDFTSQGKKRFSTAKFLVKNTEMRDYFLQFDQKNISPVMIQRKAEKLGLPASYMNCVNAFKRLMREFYGDDYSQYPCVPSYIETLKDRGHRACCEVVDGEFVRLAIVYREGIQAFSQYANRGLSIDGTFLKTLTGGTLLVACCRNGNLELQIVGIAVVSIENQDNWDFFLRFLMANLKAHPHFLISDRDKGLVPAAAALEPNQTHFFCFRHLMENFNRRFKSRPLKNAAWALARSLTEVEFIKQAAILKSMNQAAEAWLMDVGKDKWSLCYSPCPRFGTLTSNNVESVNGALRKIRKLPILDCLMSIERYIGDKWTSNSANALKWGLLTHRASKRMEKHLSLNPSILVSQQSESAFVVTEYVRRGEPPAEFAVQLFEKRVVCTCGYTKDMAAPCIHSFVCLRKAGMLSDAHQFFDKTWTTRAYSMAYKQDDPLKMSPPVLKEMLIATDCAPPKITKRRGRPKKNSRRESQHATLALKKKKGKKQR